LVSEFARNYNISNLKTSILIYGLLHINQLEDLSATLADVVRYQPRKIISLFILLPHLPERSLLILGILDNLTITSMKRGLLKICEHRIFNFSGMNTFGMDHFAKLLGLKGLKSKAELAGSKFPGEAITTNAAVRFGCFWWFAI